MSEASEHLEAWDTTGYEPPYKIKGVNIHNVEQNSEDWLGMRQGLITASNAVILLKKGKNAAKGANGSDTGTNFWCERGHILEDEAIEIYEEVTGQKVERVGFVTNSKYPECGYSPDGWGKRLIEVKCFKADKHLECIKDIPIPVYCQIQFGMMIAEQDQIDVIFYNPDIEDSKQCFKIVTVDKDEKIINKFKEKLK